MKTNLCKAVNPATCRYHSKAALVSFQTTLEKLKDSYALTGDLTYLEATALKNEINLYEARIDAHQYGIEKLTKEFQKAVAQGDNATAASLAARLQNATQARMKDGMRDSWGEAGSSPEKMWVKVSEVLESQNEVRVPAHLASTSTMLGLYKNLEAEGYTVSYVDVTDSKFRSLKGDEFDKFRTFFLEDVAKLKTGTDVKDLDIFKTTDEHGGMKYLINGLVATKGDRIVAIRETTDEEEFGNRVSV